MLTYSKSGGASDVVNELALLLTGGRLSDNSRASIEGAYSSTLASSNNDVEKALRMAQKLIVASPEFHSTGVFKPLSQARPTPELPSPSNNGYKAVVFVNLDGGLDSFNTLVPHSKCTRGPCTILLFHLLFINYEYLLIIMCFKCYVSNQTCIMNTKVYEEISHFFKNHYFKFQQQAKSAILLVSTQS